MKAEYNKPSSPEPTPPMSGLESAYSANWKDWKQIVQFSLLRMSVNGRHQINAYSWLLIRGEPSEWREVKRNLPESMIKFPHDVERWGVWQLYQKWIWQACAEKRARFWEIWDKGASRLTPLRESSAKKYSFSMAGLLHLI